jgi:hypothetical protein
MQRIRLCVSIFAGSCLFLTCIGQSRAQDKAGAPETPPGRPGNAVAANNSDYTVTITNLRRLNVSHRMPSLLAKYKSTEDESERSKIAKELTVIAGEEFDARQAARDKEIDKLELQVKRLRESQARRASEKEEIVKDHVRLLLRSASGLGWSSDGEESGTAAPNGRPDFPGTSPVPLQAN